MPTAALIESAVATVAAETRDAEARIRGNAAISFAEEKYIVLVRINMYG